MWFSVCQVRLIALFFVVMTTSRQMLITLVLLSFPLIMICSLAGAKEARLKKRSAKRAFFYKSRKSKLIVTPLFPINENTKITFCNKIAFLAFLTQHPSFFAP